MTVTAIKTPPVVAGTNLLELLDACLADIPERSVVVVTSKIVSIWQGRVVKNDGTITKDELVQQEAQRLVAKHLTEYDLYLTVKGDTLIANAGIDESNADGNFILWPDNPQKAAADIWEHLRAKHHLTSFGVLITDSVLIPLRWGTRGFGLAWCGFEPLKNYIGEPDVFGRPLHMTQASLIDGLAASAVTVMGEGNEQTPLALITDPPLVFTDHPPTEKDVAKLRISDLSEDIYSPVLTAADWQPGGAA